jgi:hypothetical protein
MMPVAFPNWGERSWLYDKSLQYLMSLDLLYKLPVSPESVAGTNARLPMVAVPPDGAAVSTYRAVGALLFKGVDKIEREVPEARLIHGTDSLQLRDEGAVELDGHLLLEVDTAEPLAISYSGMLELSGGTLQLASARSFGPPPPPGPPGPPPKSYQRRIRGKSFIATRQEVAIPRYRWLIYNQFVGVGRVEALAPIGDDPWLITMSYDLYLGL